MDAAVSSDKLSDKNVEEKAKWLMALPPVRELDLPDEAGKPAQRLMHKLGYDAK